MDVDRGSRVEREGETMAGLLWSVGVLAAVCVLAGWGLARLQAADTQLDRSDWQRFEAEVLGSVEGGVQRRAILDASEAAQRRLA